MPKFQKGDIVSIQGTVEDVQVENNGSDYESVSIQWPDSRGYHDAKALTLVERSTPKIGAVFLLRGKGEPWIYLGKCLNPDGKVKLRFWSERHGNLQYAEYADLPDFVETKVI